MADRGADQTEGNDRQNDERPRVAREHPGEDDIHRAEADERAEAHVGEGVSLFLRLAGEAVFDSVRGGDGGHLARRQRRDQFRRIGDRSVHIGDDRRFAPAVLAADDGEAARFAELGDMRQRHFGPAGGTQAEEAEGLRTRGVARQLHAHRHLLVAAREPRRHRAFEGVAQLAGDACGREPEGAAARRHRDCQLALAPGQIVVRVADSVVVRQRAAQVERRRLQRRDRIAGQAHVDVASRRSAPAFPDGQGFKAGERADLVAPRRDEVRRAHVAPLGRRQFDLHPAEMVARVGGRPRGPADHAPDLADREPHRRFPFRRQRGLGAPQRLLQLGDHRFAAAARRTVREGETGDRRVALGRGEEHELEAPAGDRADTDHETRQSYRKGGVTPAHRQGDEAAERPVAEPGEAGVEGAAEPRGPVACARQRAAHMAGQDEETFDEARRQHGRRNDRDREQDAPDGVADQGDGKEHGYGRERRAGHRRQHAPRPGHRRFQPAGPGGAPRQRVFAHHDGVVDDDAEHHDQREQRHHVDRLIRRKHRRQRRHHRHRDAHRDPQGDGAVEEDEEHREHQQQPPEAVAQKEVYAVVDGLRRDVVLFDRHARRQFRREFGERAVDDLREFEGVVPRRALDVQFDRAGAVDRSGRLAGVERVADLRDVAEEDALAVAPGADFHIGELRGAGAEAEAAYLELARAGGVARRKVAAAAGDGGGDVARRRVQPEQRLRRDFDEDFLVARAEHRHPVDAARQQRLADALGARLQHRLRVIAGDRHPRHGVVEGDALHDGAFGALGQGRRLCDDVLDFRQAGLDIRARLELDNEPPRPLARGSAHLLRPGDGAKAGFERRDDGGVDIGGAGPRPDDGDRRQIEVEIGEELGVVAVDRDDPGDDGDQHEEVGRGRVAREEPDRAAGRHCATTFRPGPISVRRVTAMASPSSSAPATRTVPPSRATASTSRASRRPSTTA